MSTSVDSARLEWEDGRRRLESFAHDRARYLRLLEQVEALIDELRRRVGQTYTLADLAEAYSGAEPWSRDVLGRGAPASAWASTLAVVESAAFDRYQRGAIDYEP